MLEGFLGKPKTDPSVVEPPKAARVDQSRPGISQIAEDLRRNRQRTRKSDELDAELDAARVQAQIDELWAPENVDGLACFYFDARFASTGYTGFELTEKERKRLAVPCSMALKLLHIDPRWAGLVVYCSIMTNMVIVKESGYRRALADKRPQAPSRPQAVPPRPA